MCTCGKPVGCGLTSVRGGAPMSGTGKREPVIAMDGPAGVGKSTVAREVARRLGLTYIDTGAMYRAVSLKLLRLGIDPGDEAVAAEMAAESVIELVADAGDTMRVILDGQDVTTFVRGPEVDAVVARVAANGRVRELMVAFQRRMVGGGGVVIDGRDTGTHVVPDAEYKFFLTASEAERARRRYEQLCRQGFDVSLQDVQRDIAGRDRQDIERHFSPLRPAEDAIIINTTHLNQEQVLEFILEACGVRTDTQPPGSAGGGRGCHTGQAAGGKVGRQP